MKVTTAGPNTAIGGSPTRPVNFPRGLIQNYGRNLEGQGQTSLDSRHQPSRGDHHGAGEARLAHTIAGQASINRSPRSGYSYPDKALVTNSDGSGIQRLNAALRPGEPTARSPDGSRSLRSQGEARKGRMILMKGRLGALSTAIAAAVWCVLAIAGTASASGAGAVSYTQHFNDVVVDQEATNNPCSGASGTLTLVADNGVAHITILTSGQGAGTFWATFTATGPASFVPDDPSQPSYSGKFTIWDGENGNLKNQTATFTGTFHLTGTDGSILRLHDTSHMSVSASGIGGISFDKPVLTCG